MPRQPFGPGSKAGHSTETRHTPASSRRDYRAVSSVIDADSEDEEEVVERFGNKRLGQNVQDGKQRVLNTNPNTHCQPSHPSKTQYLSNHIIDENQPSSTHPLSWNRNPQYKEVKERFKYTDTNGTDLWACVKTVYDADGRHVFLLEDDEPAMEVEMYPAGGRSYYDREDYPNQTKYWRDHHVPEYSIERLKPYVLRDAYVPEYSRLSARAQAWRGFTKPTLNLMQRLSTPLGHYNRSSSQAKYYSSQREYLAGHKRSFHKYRNRQRTKRFNERTKINLATFVASPSTERDMHIDSNVVNNTNEIPDNLHAIIIENLPEELTASYVKGLLEGYGIILAVRSLPVSVAGGVMLVVVDLSSTAVEIVQALNAVIFEGNTLRCSKFSKMPQDALRQVVQEYRNGTKENNQWQSFA